MKKYHNEKKHSEEMQTLRAGCSKAEPKIFAPPQTPSRGAGRPTFNQLEMVTTFTYKHSLLRIDARNFELIVVTDPQTNNTVTHPQTGLITMHCAAASAQCNQKRMFGMLEGSNVWKSYP